jgi:hypothetical protein
MKEAGLEFSPPIPEMQNVVGVLRGTKPDWAASASSSARTTIILASTRRRTLHPGADDNA